MLTALVEIEKPAQGESSETEFERTKKEGKKKKKEKEKKIDPRYWKAT